MSKFVVAVSGGVDSMVLLDILVKRYGPERLIVSHVDHGIREESNVDQQLVRQASVGYGITHYETTQLNLGSDVSEEQARDKRYAWLKAIKAKYNALRIITAHHQDDVIETVIMNLSRGTRWRGLSSLKSNDVISRPLLGVSKSLIVSYALEHDLKWNEDRTNQDVRLTRNYIRHKLVPRLTSDQRRSLIALERRQRQLRDEIESETTQLLGAIQDDRSLPRYWLIMNSSTVRREMVQAWLGRTLQQDTLERIDHFIATARQGHKCDVEKGFMLEATTTHLVVKEAGI